MYEAGIEMPSAIASQKCHQCSRLYVPVASGRGAKLTLERPHHAVEAFRTQLVVAERAEQLADNDVGLFPRAETPHVRVDELDLAAPFEC